MHEHLHALAIHAYYAGEHDCGRRSSERLLNLPGLPPEIEQQARSNRSWYTQSLSGITGGQLRLERINCEPAHPGWSLFNPTIAADRDGLLMLVRSSNYKIVDGRYVMPPEDGGVIRTENILRRYGTPGQTTLIPPAYEINGFPVAGLEDCRLRRTQGGWGVSATVRDAAPWDGRCRIGVAALDIDEGRLSGLRVLDWEGLAEHEKNWMPCGEGWVYACGHNGHTVTVDPDADLPGVYEVRQRGPAPPMARGFRGGGQVVPFRDGWLAIVHEVAAVADGRRAYEHRFVWFDASFTIKRWSPLFFFADKQSIEFAAGLAIVGETVFVSYGVRDAEAWLASMEGGAVWDLLKPVS
jgi:predicted GH43/DUF377 family glycosyl hydrolase